MKRRTFLGSAGTTGIAGLAGCLDGPLSDDDSSDDGGLLGDVAAGETPTGAAESYVQLLLDCETNESEYFHEDIDSATPEFEVEIIESEVQQESVSSFEVNNRLTGTQDTGTVRDITESQDTATVAVTIGGD